MVALALARSGLAVLAVLALASVGWAQTLTLPTDPVPPYTLARCSIDGVDQAQWDVTSLGSTDGQADGLSWVPDAGAEQRGHGFAFTAPPGRYKVVAYGIASGQLVVRTGLVSFAGQPEPEPGPAPPIPPTPRPTPTPTPAPDPGPIPPDPPPGSLAALGRAYLASFEAAFRSSAAAVRAGTLTDHNAAVGQVERERDPARIAFGAAVREAMDRMRDPQTGRITDPAGYAAVLDQAAAALRVGP